ncbi:MAG: phage minor capsid protein [Enterocloster sp.]
MIEATTHDMEAAEAAVLRKANDDYRKAIFNAQVYANTGAGTYEKAVDMATKDMLSRGLNCIVYANGARHTLSDYADMAIRTASKRAYLQGEGEKRQEWGISTVIVNKRGNPCPKCLPFVGKVLIDDVWSGGKKSDGPYPLMSKAVAAGLYHPRCKDSHTTYFPGISTADDIWARKELEGGRPGQSAGGLDGSMRQDSLRSMDDWRNIRCHQKIRSSINRNLKNGRGRQKRDTRSQMR